MVSTNCPLCARPLDASADLHHLIPKTFKGKETILIHKICHRKIHSVFTERELLHYFHTIERLKEHPDIQAFIKWVSKKHPEFYDSSKDSGRKKRR